MMFRLPERENPSTFLDFLNEQTNVRRTKILQITNDEFFHQKNWSALLMCVVFIQQQR